MNEAQASGDMCRKNILLLILGENYIFDPSIQDLIDSEPDI